MRQIRIATCTFLLFVVPSLQSFATPAAANASTVSSADADLETLADFVPKQVLRDLLVGACDVSYPAKLAEQKEVEQALPGIHERMIAAASQYCRANMDQTIEAVRIHIKDRWRSKFSPVELHQLAVLYGPSLALMSRSRVSFKPGDTAIGAVGRSAPTWHDDGDFDRRARIFVAAPGGKALLERAEQESKEISEHARDDEGLVSFTKGMLRTAHEAANAYAIEKGYKALYPV